MFDIAILVGGGLLLTVLLSPIVIAAIGAARVALRDMKQ